MYKRSKGKTYAQKNTGSSSIKAIHDKGNFGGRLRYFLPRNRWCFQKFGDKSLQNIWNFALSLSDIFLLSDVVPMDWEVTQNLVTDRD